MCCSIRAAVFFVGSVHIFFAILQMISIFPLAVANLGEKLLVSTLAFIYLISYFSSGFMTFRGADEESATLIRLSSLSLFLTLIFRFLLMSFNLMLVETLPEASFLYVYGTSVIPIIFTVIIYLVYEAILFCYHNELKHVNQGQNNLRGQQRMLSSPLNFHSSGQSPRRQVSINHGDMQQQCGGGGQGQGHHQHQHHTIIA